MIDFLLCELLHAFKKRVMSKEEPVESANCEAVRWHQRVKGWLLFPSTLFLSLFPSLFFFQCLRLKIPPRRVQAV